ncbi:hypothetical protein FSP39_025501 [Pinctada imbricata]|uniref:Uncharacterized protein n=1 Tax=Pinctada imbricata TaxID=66713 RepID=A0AA88YD26_PINIB|nr:hypothetical protein FSP39_025501 [Pinctada imbricata]
MSLLVLYVILLTWLAYRATEAVVDYSQWESDVTFTLLMAVVVVCEAFRLVWKIFTSDESVPQETHNKVKPKGKLFLMREASRRTGHIIFASVTDNKEEILSYNPHTRKIRMIMVVPRLTEEEYNSIFN